MNITLYSFTKRKNSTKRPADGTTYTGTLKDNTSVVNPSVIFEFSAFPAYNYAYIQEFARYYWITDKTHVANNVWIITMHVDVLASYKNEIGGSSKYVLRSAAAFDGTISDFKYPIKNTTHVSKQTKATGWDQLYTNDTFVLGIISPSGNTGALDYRVVNYNDFQSIRNQLMAPQSGYYDAFLFSDQDIKNFAKLVSNPFQYFAVAREYPFAINTDPNPFVANITVGGYTIQGSFQLLFDPIVENTFTFNISDHPEAATRGRYLNFDPFTSRCLIWEPIGTVFLNNDLLINATKINATYTIDVFTGFGKFIVTTEGGTEVYRTDFVAGMEVPLAQTTSNNPLKLINGIGDVAGAVVNGITGNIGGAISSGLSAVGNAVGAGFGDLQGYKNGSGSILQNDDTIQFVELFKYTCDDNNAEYGKPLMATRTLSNLSGYILCADGEIETDGTEPEISEIETYLTGGFFYE